MVRYGLKAKILSLTTILMILGFGALIMLVIAEEEKSLLSERTKASELMAEPILHTIYKDMLDERADMPRFLIEGLKTIKGVERVQLIRSNGVEEAFQDYKTLNAVKAEFGETKPEWLVDHPMKLNNVARGIEHPEFKKAINEFKLGRKDAATYIERDGDRAVFSYLVPIVAKPKCSGCHAQEEGARGVLMITTSLDEMYVSLAKSRNKWIIHGFATVAAVFVLLGLLVSGVITRPIDKTVAMLKEIADGKGDLTRRLDVATEDEVGLLGKWFNKFIDNMQGMVKHIYAISGELTASSSGIAESSRRIIESVRRQLRAAEDTTASIKEMDASIKTVAEQADSLSASAKDVSDSAHLMSSTADAVKLNIDRLSYSGESTTSAINEIAVSINQVSSNVDALFSKTEEVVSSIFEVGERVREVERYSRRQAELAEKVRSDAEETGLSSVVKTKEGIELVSEEVFATSRAVNRLAERSKEIGRILTVINDIADTTHLLALNASALAAQSGEHGKGFAVVARQIKDLAAKTSAYTGEIGGLIAQVQRDLAEAVESMRVSSGRVEDGVRLSRNAQEALAMIVESARSSLEMARLIERATVEQTKGAFQISNAAQVMSDMVSGIKQAANEQTVASEEMLKDMLRMKELMDMVRTSANDQTRESRHVTEAIFKVAEKLRRVAGATSEQMMLSKKIVEAVETVRNAAGENAALAERLDKTVQEMNLQSEKLKSTVGNFKT